MLHGAADLLTALLRKLETQPSGVTGSSDHAGGVVLNAARVQKADLT